jgi:predicted AlkP superfamily pyrophosphatase or phosphodiesterase
VTSNRSDRVLSPRHVAAILCAALVLFAGRFDRLTAFDTLTAAEWFEAHVWSGQEASRPAPARHVIIISIDGLRPADYLPGSERRAAMPALEALRANGSWAEGVIGQYPSLTYPSHTSIATGTRPARHGVTQNTRFDPGNGSAAWFFESSAIKVPAIWDVAARAGLTTSGISWPVTVGAKIDYLIPETNQAPRNSTWLDLARQQSTPGLIDAVAAKLTPLGPPTARSYQDRDRFSAMAARLIIEKHRPNLMLLHLVEVDGARHNSGPDSPEAMAALRNVDERIAEIVGAVEAAGLAPDTAFIVTGDHGFYRVHSAFQPNAVLRDAGLLEVDASGRVVRWQAMAHRAAIYLKDPALAQRVRTLFEGLAAGRYHGLFRVVDRAEVARLGGDPDAALIIEPIEGFTTAAGTSGGFLVASPRRGDHGFLPTEPPMHTGLVVSGAGVLKGVVVPLTRQIDIAPTAARLLGIEFSEAEGVPIVGVLGSAPVKGSNQEETGTCAGHC